jgi:hypothetical protein
MANTANAETLVHDLMQLTTKEQTLLNQIYYDLSSGTVNSAAITSDISGIIQQRLSIYNFLYSTMNAHMSSLAQTDPVLSSQLQALQMVESQLNTTRNQINQIKKDNTNKLRLIEINEYFGDMYEDQSWVMKIIVVVSIHVCVLCLLYRLGMPKFAFFTCLGGTFVVGAFLLIRKLVDISYRDNMNYQEYAWQMNTNPNSINAANATATNPWYSESNVNCSAAV